MAIDLYKNRCAVYEGDKPYIFVSYSHRDIEKVVALIRRLDLLGFRVWYDSGIPAGSEWGEEIAAHLKNSGCVLSLLTPNSVKSRHFRREFGYADHLQKDILAVYLEECEPSPGLEMQVVSQQCIKCEHCENDDDLLEEIARAQILQPCRGDPERDREAAGSAPGSSGTDLQVLRERAADGDAQAQHELGGAYEYGIGVEQSCEEAARWYAKAAAQKLPMAIRALGLCCEYGQGVARDPRRAAELYRQSSDLGCAAGTNSLGYCYEMGIGVERDTKRAVELYARAAQRDDPYAQQNLALCYEYSKGVDQDWAIAAFWYRRAAEQGVAYSQMKLAECCRKGLGVPVDTAEADRWQKCYDENPNK